jgi:uncharacterized protein
MNIKRRASAKAAQKTQPNEEQEFEQKIIDYLRVKKDFFVQHPALLTELTIPHPSGDAISLVERQLMLLREQNRHLKRQLQDLIKNAQANASLNKKVQQLILTILAAATPQGKLEALFASLRADFKVDVLTLWLFLDIPVASSACQDHADILLVPRDAPELAPFCSVLKSAQPVCGRLTWERRQYLFGDSAESTVSCALIPLGTHPCKGLFAMGSRELERFHPELGTLFLDFLGAVIERTLQQYGH